MTREPVESDPVPSDGPIVRTRIDRRLAELGLVSSGARIAQLLVRALSVPLSIALLGPDLYGYWLAIGSFSAWFSVSDLGIGQLSISQLAAQMAAGDVAMARRVLQRARRLYLWLSCALAGLFLLASGTDVPATVLGARRNLVSTLQIDFCFLIVGLSLALNTYVNTASILNQVILKNERNYIATTIGPILSLIWLSGFRVFGGELSLVDYAILMSMPGAICNLTLYFYTLQVESQYVPQPSDKPLEPSRGLVSSTASIVIIQIADLVIYYTPIVYITRALGPSPAASFGVAASIFMIGVNLCFGWGQAHLAVYALEAGRKNFSEIRRLHRRLLRVTLGSFGLFALTLAAAGTYLVNIYTAQRVMVPWQLMCAMAGYYILLVASQQNGFLLVGMGLERIRAAIQLSNALAMLAGLYAVGQGDNFLLLFPFISLSLLVDCLVTIQTTRGTLNGAGGGIVRVHHE